jgi:hypothetical protein
MNPMLEPFFYEAVVAHQDELRRAARPSVAPDPATPPLRADGECFRVHPASRDDRATVIPCLSRLLWRSR